jgi:CBS domain-containing protein
MGSTAGDLMSDPVLTVARTDSAASVAEAMLEAAVGSVVIIDEDCYPVGILTATDYITLTAEGTDPYEATVGEQMTADIVTVHVDESATAAAKTMAENALDHLPVVGDDGQAIGMLTTTDLTAYFAETT